jgi:predicted oxidoreductase
MTTRREFLTQAALATLLADASTAPARMAQAGVTPTASGAAAKPGRPMKTYTVPHTDLVVSRLAYGNAMIGSDSNSSDFIAQTVRVARTAYEQGITFFDTADVYGGGKSELALGQLLKDIPGSRRQLVIQSKCSMREGGVIDSSREHITGAVEGSLKRLDTDYLDILLLHWPDSLIEPEEVGRAFDELHRAGKVRHFGVSNYSPNQLELLRRHVRQPLVANQIQLGIAHWYTDPGASKAAITHGAEGVITLDYCRLQEIQVQAYSPLKAASVGKPPNLLNPPPDAPSEVRKAADALQNVARTHDTSPAAIMLAWLLHHPAGIVPIIGATKVEHVVDNCAADRVELSRAEWYSLLRTTAALEQQGAAA